MSPVRFAADGRTMARSAPTFFSRAKGIGPRWRRADEAQSASNNSLFRRPYAATAPARAATDVGHLARDGQTCTCASREGRTNVRATTLETPRSPGRSRGCRPILTSPSPCSASALEHPRPSRLSKGMSNPAGISGPDGRPSRAQQLASNATHARTDSWASGGSGEEVRVMGKSLSSTDLTDLYAPAPPRPVAALKAATGLPRVGSIDLGRGGVGSGGVDDIASVTGKPRPVGPRAWLRMNESGVCTPITIDKHRLASQLRVPMRDLRMLEPNQSKSYSAAILSRERCLVVHLEQVRLLITAEEVYLQDGRNIPSRGTSRSFSDAFSRESSSSWTPTACPISPTRSKTRGRIRRRDPRRRADGSRTPGRTRTSPPPSPRILPRISRTAGDAFWEDTDDEGGGGGGGTRENQGETLAARRKFRRGEGRRRRRWRRGRRFEPRRRGWPRERVQADVDRLGETPGGAPVRAHRA